MSNGLKMTIITVLAVLVLLALLRWSGEKQAGPSAGTALVMYCAAGSKPPVEEIAKQYEAAYGVKIQLQYGGSGTLLSNLQIADKGDIYLAADHSYVDIARGKGLIDEELPVADQRAVIAVRKGNPKKIQSLEDLLRNDVRVALGSPDAASIGKHMMKILTAEGKWTALQKRVQTTGVFKPTVNEIANDVKIGAVDAAVVWDNVAAQYPELEAIHVPLFDASVKQITVTILKTTRNPTDALRFARYLTARDRGAAVFREMGYDAVQGDVWAEHPEVVLFSGGVNRLAVQDTLAEFEEREGVTVLTTYQGCGILVGEMKAGMRPDAYFACDSSYMEQVSDLFLDRIDVAETDMVILVHKGNPKNIRSLEDLSKPGVRVAVANPKYSALGGLSVKLLKKAGLYDSVQKNITYGDAPTADLLTVRVRTDREDAAIVYRANTVYVTEELDVVEIDHPAAHAIQPVSVAKDSKYRYLMERLVSAILSAESQERFESKGFSWRGGEGRQ
ncbi:MAG: molybdate ABC transporter substrate-binding protein [Kiritimatiellales bacterium]|nr:molybdate ABC transporter substrate-binding protein [Kiritimatiellales bacterium]